jgi:hypothetical protein
MNQLLALQEGAIHVLVVGCLLEISQSRSWVVMSLERNVFVGPSRGLKHGRGLNFNAPVLVTMSRQVGTGIKI